MYAPAPQDVENIVSAALSATVTHLKRFNTGNHHFVYDVHLADGRNVVVRLARPEERKAIEGAVYWSALLKPRGVPLPDILHADAAGAPFPYMILQRLPGTDLRYVYHGMSSAQRRALVAQLVTIQSTATSLPEGKGFGYSERMDGPFQHPSWTALIAHAITRTRERIVQAGHFSLGDIERIDNLFGTLSGYFDDVRPTPFLHDMTSKNVLIENGRLTGIVDVDSLCFGDPLYLPGLIQAAFLADGLENDYIGYWKEALSLSPHQKRVVDFYAAQTLANIMSEIGLAKNDAEEKNVLADDVKHFSSSLSHLLDRLQSSP